MSIAFTFSYAKWLRAQICLMNPKKKKKNQIGFAKGKVSWQPIITNEIELPRHFFINELTYF